MVTPLATDSPEARIGRAWRELIRGTGLQALRQHLFPVVEAAQLDALDVLAAATGPLRMSEFAAALGVDASTVTRTVTRLEAGGHVQRVRSSGDGRGVTVELTAPGEVLVAEVADRRRELLFRSLEPLGDAERVTLATLLEEWVGGIETFANEAAGGPPAPTATTTATTTASSAGLLR
ncbi:MAG: MarR family winged helix-turn-helix transcriptional regulator [Microthrixaceae bacterium]